MKKIYLILVMAFSFIFNTAICQAKPVTYDFLNHKFYLNGITTDVNYDIINEYYAKEFETANRPASLIISYAQIGFQIKSAYDNTISAYGKYAKIGSKKESADKKAFSYMFDESGRTFYALMCFKNNSIAGVDNIELILEVPYKSDIKTLDTKYFEAFYKNNFPLVITQEGKTLPPYYSTKLGGKNFVLKYAYSENGEYNNRYLPKNENFVKYKQYLIINYRTDKTSPQKVVKEIIEAKHDGEGFKIIKNEKYGNAQILSYIIDIMDFSNHKTYSRYSVFKIEPFKKSIKSVEYGVNIPQNTNLEQKINTTDLKYRELIKTYEIPKPVTEHIGRLPADDENPYYELVKGITK